MVKPTAGIDFLQLRKRPPGDETFAQPGTERRIMDYHRDAVARESHIQLNALSAIAKCPGERGERVLWSDG